MFSDFLPNLSSSYVIILPAFCRETAEYLPFKELNPVLWLLILTIIWRIVAVSKIDEEKIECLKE